MTALAHNYHYNSGRFFTNLLHLLRTNNMSSTLKSRLFRSSPTISTEWNIGREILQIQKLEKTKSMNVLLLSADTTEHSLL